MLTSPRLKTIENKLLKLAQDEGYWKCDAFAIKYVFLTSPVLYMLDCMFRILNTQRKYLGMCIFLFENYFLTIVN